MRILVRLGLALAIVALLFANANVLAERIAEDMVADAIAREFDLQRRPRVDLTGFPVLVRAVRGDLPDVGFRAADVLAGDLQIETLTVSLRGLRGRGSLLSSGPYSIAVRSGTAEVVVAEDAVNALLASRDEDARVRINRGAVRVRTTISFFGPRAVSAAARVRLQGRRLRISPVPGTVTVDGRPAPSSLEELARREAQLDVQLPALPGGIEPGGLVLEPGRVRIGASLRNRTIRVR